jgi:predicted DCC family thiol-disulfide oxidoreductase YuxK
LSVVQAIGLAFLAVALLAAALLAVHGVRARVRLAARFPARTNPPAAPVVLFDGRCEFCRRQVDNLKRLLGAVRATEVEWLSFQDRAVLARFPGLSYDACTEAMVLITLHGRVCPGLAGAAELLADRSRLARAYFLPVLRAFADGSYALVAAHRYRLMGKAVAVGACDGSCAHHGPKR